MRALPRNPTPAAESPTSAPQMEEKKPARMTATRRLARWLRQFLDRWPEEAPAEQLRESVRVLDASPDAILTIDRSGIIQFWNRNANRLFGYTAEQALHRNAYELIFPEGRSRLETLVKGIDGGRETEIELKETSKERKAMTLVVRLSLVAGHDNVRDLILLVCRDVTSLKEREATRLRSERLQSIGTLASGVAHDINNALLPILFGAEMLQINPDDPKRLEYINQVMQNAERVQTIMRQIQLFVGNLRPAKKQADVAQVVRDTNQIIKHTFPKGIHLKTRIADGLWQVLGDEQQIGQIVLNLAFNARDAMGEQGSLGISAENVQVDAIQASQQVNAKEGPHVLITVEDTGTGIDNAILDKIFDPFFTTKPSGSGLGLATALGIVKSHGGFLTLSTEVARGSSFKVWLPAIDGPDPTLSPDPFPIPMGEGETILVIDDEEGVRSIAKQALESCGYKVLTAEDGTSGVTLLTQHPGKIGAVLCDMMMPFMDGPATIRALHKIEPDLPVLAMSGLIEDKAKQAKEAGAAVLLQKPFTAKTLLKTVALFVKG